jgi:hypothetical protein
VFCCSNRDPTLCEAVEISFKFQIHKRKSVRIAYIEIRTEKKRDRDCIKKQREKNGTKITT